MTYTSALDRYRQQHNTVPAKPVTPLRWAIPAPDRSVTVVAAADRGRIRKRQPTFVTTTEAEHMRTLRAAGMTYAAIGRALRRPPETVRDHTLDVPTPGQPVSAETLQRYERTARQAQALIDQCNQTLAETGR